MRWIFALVLAAFLPGQDVLSVPGQYPTIQAAIAAAARGSVIEVGPGVWTGPVALGDGMRLMGAGPDVCTITSGPSDATLLPWPGATPLTMIEGFTITGPGHGLWMDEEGLTVSRCRFVNCGTPLDPLASAVNTQPGTRLVFIDCTFENNAGTFAIHGDERARLDFFRCRIVNNAGSGLFLGNGRLEDCLVAGNAGTGVILGSGLDGSGKAVNCTFSANLSGFSGPAAPPPGAFVSELVSCVVWGNGLPYVQPVPVSWSNVEGGLLPGPGNLSSPPSFLPSPAGLYALAPGSPGVDAGAPTSSRDPDGTPPDMGWRPSMPVLGGHSMGSGMILPCFLGEPLTTLTLNGSDGGLARRVTLPAGTPSTLGFASHLIFPEPEPFALLLKVGVATAEQGAAFPGLGGLCFDWTGLFSGDLLLVTDGITERPDALFPPLSAPTTLQLPGLPAGRYTFQDVVLLDTVSASCSPGMTLRASNALLLDVY